MGFYLSTNSTISTQDIIIGNCTFSSLGAGATNTCSGPLTLSTSLSPGIYRGGAIVDDQGQVDESDECNNSLAAPNTMGMGGVV